SFFLGDRFISFRMRHRNASM
ncbi:hypothetical protein CSUI_006604, partial [Cystoisospora suis]